MNQPDKKIQIEHFQNIVAVAHADGILDAGEKEFLSERAEDYGLARETVEKILNNVDNLEFIIPLNNEEREEQLSDAVYMAMIDGNVEAREYNLCLKIAEKLDLDRNYLDEVIDLTKRLWDNG